MASLYDLSVVNVALNIDNNISSMTIKVLNADTPVTDILATGFVIHSTTNLTAIPYTADLSNNTTGMYTIAFTTPQPKGNPLMIYAKSADNTKLSKTLYYDYFENVSTGIINTNFNISNPGTYKFKFDKINDTAVGSETNKTITVGFAADKTYSKIEIVDIDTTLVQIITDTGLQVPLKLTLKDQNDNPVTNGDYKIAISDVKQSTPAKSSSKEEDPK